jgi:hypothetical protein
MKVSVFALASCALALAWGPAVAGAAEAIRICPKIGDDCTHTSIRRALAAADDGATVRIASGIYPEGGVLTANRVRIEAESGATLLGEAAEGKAALVIKGNDTVVEGLICSGVEVPSGNGACLRLEGRNLTLRGVHFHHSQAGLLAFVEDGTIVIEDSAMEDNGIAGQAQGHNISVGGDVLEFRRSRSLRARGEGNELRSTARRTVIEDSVVASLDGDDSRLIDVVTGGEVVVRNSVLEEGPNSANSGLIGFALTGDRPSRLELVDNVILLDGRRGQLVQTRPNQPVLMQGNTMIGGADPQDGDTKWFPDRAAAGYAPYPALKN